MGATFVVGGRRRAGRGDRARSAAPSSDRELVAAARRGDPNAFAAIYDTYADRIYAYCCGTLRDPDDAADATQDTFVKAVERLDQLRDPTRLAAWLFASARNETANQGRRRGRTRPMAECGELRIEDGDLGGDAAQAELSELLWAAAEGLPPRDREVMALQLHAGMTAAEIGDTLGVSVEHARVLTSRMRQRLEQCLGTLLVARLGRDDCPDLSSHLRGWDGTLTVELRSRLGRHIERCEPCRATRSRLVVPARLLPVVLVLAAPAALRWRTASALARRVPPRAALGGTGSNRRLLPVAGLVATIALVAGSLVATDTALPWEGDSGAPEVATVEAVPPQHPAPIAPEEPAPPPAPDVAEPTIPPEPSPARSPEHGAVPQGSGPIVDSDAPLPAVPASLPGAAPTPVAACGLLADDLTSPDSIVEELPLGTGALLDQLRALGPIASVTDLLDGASTGLLGALASVDVCVGADPRPLLDVVSGTCPVSQIDLNTAAAPVLATLPGLNGGGVVDSLLAARPVESVSQLVAATGLTVTEVGDMVASGVACLGTVPQHLLTSAGPLLALPLSRLLDLSGLTRPLAEVTEPLATLTAPVVPVLTTVLDEVDRVLSGTSQPAPGPQPPAGPGPAPPPAAGRAVVELPPVTVPGTDAPLKDLPPVSLPSVELPALTTPAIEVPAVTTPILDLPAVTVPPVEVGAVVEDMVDTVVVDTVETLVDDGLAPLLG